MTSLLDIGPLTETVTVGGKNVDIYGVTPEGFFVLLTAFPELAQLQNVKEADGASLIKAAPASIATVIAIATTDRSEFEKVADWRAAITAAAKIASTLGVHHQLAIVNAAIRMTFPEGVGPFVKQMESLTNSVNEVSGQVKATTSSSSSRSGFTTDSPGMRLGPAARSVN